MYREVTFANNLMDFITGFNITVETIKEIFPDLSHKLDNLFYDAKSYAEAYLSKSSHATGITTKVHLHLDMGMWFCTHQLFPLLNVICISFACH